MSLIKNTNPRRFDISSGLQDVLYRNGMQAHIAVGEDGSLKLVVLGHDSPAIKYDITEQQADKLMNWGYNSANKAAYNTFANIVKNDFYMPDNFVSARNAGGRVITGLSGYRIGVGEYGYSNRGVPFFNLFNRNSRGWGGDFISWGPRSPFGYHLRRIEGRPFFPNGPFVPDRPDGRMKPGEMRSGGYGFYYKGGEKEVKMDIDDPVINMTIKPLESAPRNNGNAVPYSSVITSEVYFNVDDWKNVLETHGLVINENDKTLTVQSNSARVDLKYTLTDDELNKILAPDVDKKVKGSVSIQERLNVLNNVISQDFDGKVTKEMLESQNLISIELKPDVKNEVEAKFIERDEQIRQQEERKAEQQKYRTQSWTEEMRLASISSRIGADIQAINGREIHEILGNYGFFNSEKNGRQLVVGEIRVDEKLDGTHVMSAEINGDTIEHTISKEQYDKFLQLNDEHRLKLFDDVFKEVKIRHDNGARDFEAPLITDYKSRNGDYITREDADIAHSKSQAVNGETLSNIKESKGFYREIENGREVSVGEIRVSQISGSEFRMTAIIDGKEVSHNITQKQYDKFLAVDDYHRIKMFAKIFPEVDIKTHPGMGTNIGAAVLAALTVGSDLLNDITFHQHPPFPERDRMPQAPIYFKPGVASAEEMLQRNYDAEICMNEDMGESQGMGRNMG